MSQNKRSVSKEFVNRNDVLACEIKDANGDLKKRNVQRGQIVPVGAFVYCDDAIAKEYEGCFKRGVEK